MGVNVVGSFALGLVVGWLGDGHPVARAFLGTGVLGGFTTYSAFAVQTATLLGSQPFAGAALALVSVLLGLLAAAIGLPSGAATAGSGIRSLVRAGGEPVSVWVFLAAALAGGVGAGLRYVVDVLVVAGKPGRFPLGILIVNITGSFALGVLTGLGASLVGGATVLDRRRGAPRRLHDLQHGLARVRSARAQRRSRAGGWMNAVGTLVLGVAAAAAGLAIGQLF